MTTAHSLASKARQAKITPAERSKRMRVIATIRQSKLTKKQKRENAMKMVRARLQKAKK